MQRLDKHFAVTRQQILNNATDGLQQWKPGVSTWSVPRCYKQRTKSVQLSSAREAVKRGLERVKLKNPTVRSSYQETTSEDTAGWKI
jgi:hypothetical protein